MQTTVFGEKVKKLIQGFVGQLDSQAGYPQCDLDNAEDGLGITIPKILKQYYLLAGRLSFNQAYNRLLSPDELFLTDDKALVFCRESQDVVFWSIQERDAGKEDPRVYQASSLEQANWELDHKHVSDFLTTFFYWQAVNGGLEYGSYANVDKQTVETIRRKWRSIETKGLHIGDMEFFAKSGQVLCVLPENNSYSLSVAGTTKERILDIDDVLGTDLQKHIQRPLW